MTTDRRTFLLHAALAGAGLGSRPLAAPAAAARARSGAARQDEGLRILVLGGTRFLGPHVVEAALARGHTVTLFNRGLTNPDMFPDLEKLRGDRDPDVGEGLSALEGRSWDAVVDTSAYVPRISGASAELLADAVDHYVFVSTISVYAGFEEEGMDESAPVAVVDDPTAEAVTNESYGALKALCEEAVEAAMPGRAALVRPGLIVGPLDPTDRFTYWPVRVDRGGEVLAPGDPADPVQYIDARDLAAWLVHVAEERPAGVFNATGPEARLSIAELLYGCRAVSGGDVGFTWVDGEFLTEKGVQPWSDLPVWIPPQGEMGGISSVSVAAALEQGLSFRPLAETVRDTLEWFQELPAERRESLRAGLAAEREAEVLAAWRSR